MRRITFITTIEANIDEDINENDLEFDIRDLIEDENVNVIEVKILQQKQEVQHGT
jgi:hypothetical protein